MKQELKELKELTSRFVKARDDFEAKKEVFELSAMFIPVNYAYLGLEEDYEVESVYELANMFYDKYGFVSEYADALKKEHPRFGEKRFKNTLIENIINNQEWDYEEDYEQASYLVDTYLAFEAVGYSEVKACENEMVSVAEKINENTNAVATQTVDAVKGAGRAVVNVLRPYGEVAKGQLGVAGQKAKGAVNKGAKHLIKVLEDVANKTEDNK